MSVAESIDGFCMALADSVPGVSGGTVAFIMGFYDRFIGSIHDLFFCQGNERRRALRYLVRLGIGWAIGMALASFALASVFDTHIYGISSVFIGFIFGAIPLVVIDEKETLKGKVGKEIPFLIAGILLVVLISWMNTRGGTAQLDLAAFNPALAVRLFLIGMAAISAMFLPGISGSTILLIFGAYLPVITSVKDVLTMHFSAVPALIIFALGIITGAAFVVKLIKASLEKFRTQTVAMILGMMIGSLYAIVQGPTTLKNAMPALDLAHFNILACLVGAALVLGLEAVKRRKNGRSLNREAEKA